MQPVTGHDAECGMRRILKVGIFGGDDDVAQQRIFGMHRQRPIDRRENRRLEPTQPARALRCDIGRSPPR
jgi:hypothetical protein